MQNFFSEHNLSGKIFKIKTQKTIQKQKQNQSITFCCGDCRTSMEVSRGLRDGPEGSRVPNRVTPRKTTEEK